MKSSNEVEKRNFKSKFDNIRTKLFLTLSITIIVIILFLIVVNSVVLETYYIYSKQTQLMSAYKVINAYYNGTISNSNIEIDKEGRTVKVDGKFVELSLREYELLIYLIENKNIALSRDKILNNVWNYDYYGDSRTIDSHVKKIRHKLGKKGKYIKTMRGIGYKFEIK